VVSRVWAVLIVGILAIGGIGVVNKAAHTTTIPGGSTNATVNVLPTTRSITVSPGQVTFSDCHRGQRPYHSTSTLLGQPNGECSVGTLGTHGTYPITIDNAGIPSNIEVSASNAVPADNGTRWRLCSTHGHPACTGPRGAPGVDQYKARTTARGELNATPLTASPACDFVFDASGGCRAARGQLRHEGIKLIGPTRFSDNSTSFTITITWIAVAP